MDDSIGDMRTMAQPPDDGPSYELSSGSKFYEYHILRPLGKGGMGEVYEAEHTILGLRYAIKLLPTEFATQRNALARFRDEARVMAQLKHPHIVLVDEFRETDGKYWLRMELAASLESGVTTLADLAAKHDGKVPDAVLRPVLRQVLTALSFAHRHNAIHRDLKPTNILLFPPHPNEDGCPYTAKISDFGLVKLVGEEFVRSRVELSVSRSIGSMHTMLPDAGTTTNSLLGTYEYMSPEQKSGEEVDCRSDLYSVLLPATQNARNRPDSVPQSTQTATRMANE